MGMEGTWMRDGGNTDDRLREHGRGLEGTLMGMMGTCMDGVEGTWMIDQGNNDGG